MTLESVAHWRIDEDHKAQIIGELSGSYNVVQAIKIWTLGDAANDFLLISDEKGMYLIER
jgi:soluble P-type ATPase